MFRTITILLSVFVISTGIAVAQDINTRQAVQAKCGDILEGEFTTNIEVHPYEITMAPGDSVSAYVTPIGQQLKTGIAILGPTGLVIARSENGGTPEDIGIESQPKINSGALSARGVHNISVRNYVSRDINGIAIGSYDSRNLGGVGVYSIFISCVLRDGTVIEAGSTQTDTGNGDSGNASSTNFTGYGLPPIPAVDFSKGIEIPIKAGQPQTAPIGGDVALYTYQASANSTAKLNISRVSGDISIGVVVIKKGDNSIVFLGGMPSSNNLSVDLTFPEDGTYVIGLFRLNTSGQTGTSGAVQVGIG